VRNALKKIHEQDETVDVEQIAHMLQDGMHMPVENRQEDHDDLDDITIG